MELMEEHVAFAIYLKFREYFKTTVFCWDELSKENQRMFCEFAQAAIAAMEDKKDDQHSKG